MRDRAGRRSRMSDQQDDIDKDRRAGKARSSSSASTRRRLSRSARPSGIAALAENLAIVIDIRTWDRPLFYAALPGSTGLQSRLGAAQDQCRAECFLQEHLSHGAGAAAAGPHLQARGRASILTDYVLAGGGFPVTVQGAGVIGGDRGLGPAGARGPRRCRRRRSAMHLGLDRCRRSPCRRRIGPRDLDGRMILRSILVRRRCPAGQRGRRGAYFRRTATAA